MNFGTLTHLIAQSESETGRRLPTVNERWLRTASAEFRADERNKNDGT